MPIIWSLVAQMVGEFLTRQGAGGEGARFLVRFSSAELSSSFWAVRPDQEKFDMQILKAFAIAIIAAGVLALVYGGFTYTRDTHRGNIGSIRISVQDKETVYVPVWAGVLAIVIGGGLLLASARKA